MERNTIYYDLYKRKEPNMSASKMSRAEQETLDRKILFLYYQLYQDCDIARQLHIDRHYVEQRRRAYQLQANTLVSGKMQEKVNDFVDRYMQQYLDECKKRDYEHIGICLNCEFRDCVNCLDCFREQAKKTREAQRISANAS